MDRLNTESNRKPMIVAVGRTGAGKSTILNNITGGISNFKAGTRAQSITDEYLMKESHFKGDINESPIYVFDTIGFEDTRRIDSKFMTKTQQFLLELNRGVDVILIVVSIQLSLRDSYLHTIKTVVDLLDKNITKNIILLLTHSNNLNPSLRDEVLLEFSPDCIKDSLAIHDFKINTSQIMLYENTEEHTENLITKIKDLIHINSYIIPKTSKLILENLHIEPDVLENENDIRDNTIHFVAEKLHNGLKRFLINYGQKIEGLYQDAFSIFEKFNKSEISDWSSNNSVHIELANSIHLHNEIIDDRLDNSSIELCNSINLNNRMDNLSINNPNTINNNIQNVDEQRRSLLNSAVQNIKEYRNYRNPYQTGSKAALAVAKGGVEVSALCGLKTSGKIVEKTSITVLGKKIPIIGAAIGLTFGVIRLFKQEYVKAAGEVLSGGFSCIPGWGTGVSIGLDAALISSDIYDHMKNDKKV